MKNADTRHFKNANDADATGGESTRSGLGGGQEQTSPAAGVEDVVENTENRNDADPKVEPQLVEPEETIESLRETVAALEDTLLRAKADFANTQRRNEKSRLEAVQFANADLMRSLLGVLDDFERALDAAGNSEYAKTIADGVRLVYENFKKALCDHGLESIEAIDKPFDPHVHEAIMQQPVGDRDPNTVIQEIAKGYRLKDRVIRPAKVVVAMAIESPSGAAENSQSDRKEGAEPTLDEKA